MSVTADQIDSAARVIAGAVKRMAMTASPARKAELVRAIADRTGLSRSHVDALFNAARTRRRA